MSRVRGPCAPSGWKKHNGESGRTCTASANPACASAAPCADSACPSSCQRSSAAAVMGSASAASCGSRGSITSKPSGSNSSDKTPAKAEAEQLLKGL